MATFEISPLFRSTHQGAPAYDILRTGEDEYRISLALPGWRRDEITLETVRCMNPGMAGRFGAQTDSGDPIH